MKIIDIKEMWTTMYKLSESNGLYQKYRKDKRHMFI